MRGALERRRDRGGTCGGRCPIVWGDEWSGKKKNIVALDGRQLMIYYATTNQKQAFATEGSMKERCGEREAQGKHYAIVLGALLVDRRLKNKSLSLLIIFFLSPFILFSKTPRHRPRPTSSAEAPGGGVAQNIKAVPLDRRPAPPWCCSLLDGCCLE